jgi:hypothetical protein
MWLGTSYHTAVDRGELTKRRLHASTVYLLASSIFNPIVNSISILLQFLLLNTYTITLFYYTDMYKGHFGFTTLNVNDIGQI